MPQSPGGLRTSAYRPPSLANGGSPAVARRTPLADVSNTSNLGAAQVDGVGEKPPEGVVPDFLERLRKSTGIERQEGQVCNLTEVFPSASLTTGVGVGVQPADEDIDLDVETRNWTLEFGEVVARHLRRKVDAEMKTYWLLRSKRL